jgi:hypothetical protein
MALKTHSGKGSAMSDGYPALVPREDRLLVHWYQEEVRDFISNPVYLRLPAEARGILQVLRHHFMHTGFLPNDPEQLHWLTREDAGLFRASLPAILDGGFFRTTPDEKFLYCLELDHQIGRAAEMVKKRKASGRKGGDRSGESRRRGGDPARCDPDLNDVQF